MAKKKKQSLTERIDALISRVGEKPEPTFGYIKGELVDCRSLAQSLEDCAAIREAEAKMDAAQTALEQANTQNAKIESELQAAHSEIGKFRAEQKKREEKEREIDPIQFQILERLGSPSGEWLRIDEIARALKIEVDEAEVYVEGLERLGLIFFHPHEPGGGGWLRSPEGNKLAVAKRWAGEEQTPQRKYPDLPPIEGSMLAMMVGESEGVREELIHDSLKSVGPNITLEKVKYLLRSTLKKKGFADFDPEEATYGTGNTWFITDRGTEYFAERDKL